MKNAVFEEIQQILLGCLNCWNDLDLFKVRNYYFSRMGIFSYVSEDERKMESRITAFRPKEAQDDYLGLNEHADKAQAGYVERR